MVLPFYWFVCRGGVSPPVGLCEPSRDVEDAVPYNFVDMFA